MNVRALGIWEKRCKRAFYTLAGLCLTAFLGYQAYAEDIWRPIRQNQTLSFQTTSSIQATAFGTQTYRTRLVCSVSCWISFAVSGESPNASSATGVFLPANVPEVFVVSPSSKLAVISASGATGVISITDLSK